MQTFHFFLNVQKCKTKLKNSNILKIYGHFQIPHPQISLKQFSNICENVVFTMKGDKKMIKDFRKTIKFKKIQKCSVQFFCDILQLPHTVISNLWKIDPL